MRKLSRDSVLTVEQTGTKTWSVASDSGTSPTWDERIPGLAATAIVGRPCQIVPRRTAVCYVVDRWAGGWLVEEGDGWMPHTVPLPPYAGLVRGSSKDLAIKRRC